MSEIRPMETWDCRDETVMLLVDYRGEGDHPLEDANFAITVGHNNDHNVGEGEGRGWQFAGWCWSHDHYVEGKGKPVGWLPLPHILARAYAAFDGEPVAEAEDLDSPEARLEMVRASLVMIADGHERPVALAKAGLDFCDRTQAEREAMRGEV